MQPRTSSSGTMLKAFARAIILFMLLSNTILSHGLTIDWTTKLEQRRIRVQADIDLLIKFFCSYDQTDVNCQKRLPQLREELRQIDDQLLGYKSEERMLRVRNTYQRPDHDERLPNEQMIPTDRRTSNEQSWSHDRDATVADLIRRKSFNRAEQKLLSQLRDIRPIVKDAYGDGAQNFDSLVDFASAARNGKLKFLLYKTLLEEVILRGHDEPLKVVRLLRGLQDEVVQHSSVDDETHTKAVNMVDSVKLLFEAAVAKLWIDSSISHLFEKDPTVAKLADDITTLDPNLFTQIISKVVAGVYPLLDTDHLMRNMEQFHLVPQLIDGYTAIYNEIARHNDINGKRYILKLGYYIKELMHRSNVTSALMTPEKKTQLLTLEQRLPVSVRSLVFSERVCLKSKYIHDYLHIAHGHAGHRRYAIMSPGTQLKWKPKVIDYSLYFEFPYGGFLFADDDNFDGSNRLVAASQDSDDMIEGSEWKIEPYGDDCLVRNVAFGELLYVSDEFDEDHRSNKVFSTIGNAATAMSDDRYKWTIEGC